MTITLQAVNELIASLESAGEPSIREQKFLKLAKAFKQLAAENVALKSKGKELLGEACAVYSRLNKLIDPSIGDFVDGQTLHEFQFVLDVETPATDRIVAGIKADGVKEFAESQKEYVRQHRNEMDQVLRAAYAGSAVDAERFAAQLREGADK
ncbi:hypothetical protein AM420_003154 [Klebsiella pneumoniae]|uniref:hypothetical protein n=1 Tax=Klebsiella pneumoniae TaxID=573 RepID=UPI0008FB851A|nr:hypothetical protein [Klebsiella pneumoniae]ASC20623.1 hypothetical protein AM386_01780 [Klebsiella pneumoniae]OKN55107.1 hypothetical protein AM420_003154 [Klebsiella pneumoniae]